MKANISLGRCAVACGLALMLTANDHSANAQGTAISYQGRLNMNGAPATGVFDFKFTVFDALVNGTPKSATVPANGVGVTNGLFTTTLDFGAGVFTGAPRWLEIAVATHGGANFTNLMPRTALLPAPYAIFADTAANVAAGSAVKSLNNLKDNVTLAAGANVTITPNGNTLTLASAGVGGSGIWSVNGNNAYYTAGNVGIGTTAPTVALDVRGSVAFDTGGSATLYTGTGSTELNRYLNIINAPGLPSASGLKAGGILVADSYGWDNPGKNDLVVKGSVGIGVSASSIDRLSVFGDSSLIGKLYVSGPLVVGDSFTATIGCADLLIGSSGRRGSPGRALSDLGTTLDINCCGDWVNTYIGGGNVSVCSLTIRGGCDLAEPFPTMEEHVERGSVMVIDPDHPGQLKLSTRAYDARVAGVISGGNGLNPGISLHQEGVMEAGQNVALSGRVYVNADASYGAIRPGDLLTTSDTPGHAMRVSDHAQAQGAILGKAMGSLAEGKGLVLVLVTLQ